jgi:3-oxoacyl-[acyl-carrier protein] reductase
MSEMMHDTFSGRTALVTGASGGIGGALATLLARHGADLALTYSAHQAEAEAVANAIRALGRRAVVLEGDLADPAIPARLVAQSIDQLGACDILVANAGLGRRLAWETVSLDDWETTMAVNLRAPWLMTQAALPGMIARGFGRVLYVSSVAALTGGIVGPHYAASKAGLHGLMHHLASRVADRGVTVNAIAPALIAGTRMLPLDPQDPDRLPAPIPVGRLGTADEIAAMALAMLANGYLANKVITVDGGLYPV